MVIYNVGVCLAAILARLKPRPSPERCRKPLRVDNINNGRTPATPEEMAISAIWRLDHPTPG